MSFRITYLATARKKQMSKKFYLDYCVLCQGNGTTQGTWTGKLWAEKRMHRSWEEVSARQVEGKGRYLFLGISF